MMSFPKKSWGQPIESPTMKAEIPEASLQVFADEYYQIKRIRYIRIPDGIFRWIAVHASEGVKKWFRYTFKAMPDNLLLLPLGKYMLAVPIELKTQDKKGRAVGKLHGEQKHRAEEENWIIARNQQQIMDATEQAERDAEEIKKIIENKVTK
jgi:hypothetical protein